MAMAVLHPGHGKRGEKILQGGVFLQDSNISGDLNSIGHFYEKSS
jgi:hypothetical protein